jgi:glycine hydroxymethyltransferase
MKIIADCIVMTAKDYEKSAEEVRGKVKALLDRYPLYM